MQFLLDFYGNTELSKKRNLLNELVLQLRKACNASVAEIDEFDDTERLVLGISVVVASERQVQAKLDHVINVLDSISPARALLTAHQSWALS